MKRKTVPEYTVKRSQRRTVSLEVRDDLSLLVRAPMRMPARDIERFISEHTEWIGQAKQRAASRVLHRASLDVSPEEEQRLRKRARETILPLVEKYSAIMGVSPTSVKITSARRRFGSASTRGSVCFSYRLMCYPDEAVEYVVVHELAHLLHHDHSRDFYLTVEKYLPDYKEREKILKKL